MTSIDPQLAQVLVPALVALLVVALTHRFSFHRDRENKRREQRISYLVGAFRAICKANNHPRLYEVADELEQAVADIQLFGSPEQVKMIQEIATSLGTQKVAELDQLLISLRDSLRREIGAKPTSGRVRWLRVGRLIEGDAPPTAEQLEAIGRRRAEHQANPQRAVPWEEVKVAMTEQSRQ